MSTTWAAGGPGSPGLQDRVLPPSDGFCFQSAPGTSSDLRPLPGHHSFPELLLLPLSGTFCQCLPTRASCHHPTAGVLLPSSLLTVCGLGGIWESGLPLVCQLKLPGLSVSWSAPAWTAAPDTPSGHCYLLSLAALRIGKSEVQTVCAENNSDATQESKPPALPFILCIHLLLGWGRGLPGWPGALDPPASASTAASGTTGLWLTLGFSRGTLRSLVMLWGIRVRGGALALIFTAPSPGQHRRGLPGEGNVAHACPACTLTPAVCLLDPPAFVWPFQRRPTWEQLSQASLAEPRRE